MDELLAASDVVSLHCLRGLETVALIDVKAMAAMRPTACLVTRPAGRMSMRSRWSGLCGPGDRRRCARRVRDGAVAGGQPVARLSWACADPASGGRCHRRRPSPCANPDVR
ncbi:MAG: NAD(P)-dependent oxidoreductase [Egibacteraceae bacterium]